jgi:hypothetical protein
MVARGIKKRGSAVRCRFGSPQAAQGLERARQSQTLGRLLLPQRRPIKRSTPQRPPQRRQFRRRLSTIDVFQPIRRHGYRPGVQKVQPSALNRPCQARPRPAFGPLHQSGRQGIAFDVAANGEEVFVFFNGKGLKAALVKRPGTAAVVVRVPTHGMRQGQPMQELGQFAVLMGPDNEVEVIGHEAIGQQAHGHFVLGLAQDALEGGVVAVLMEDGGACYGMVEDVVDETTGSSAWSSGHAHTLRQPPTPDKIYESRPLFLSDPFFCPGLSW